VRKPTSKMKSAPLLPRVAIVLVLLLLALAALLLLSLMPFSWSCRVTARVCPPPEYTMPVPEATFTGLVQHSKCRQAEQCYRTAVVSARIQTSSCRYES
jgi:hypothetical protein